MRFWSNDWSGVGGNAGKEEMKPESFQKLYIRISIFIMIIAVGVTLVDVYWEDIQIRYYISKLESKNEGEQKKACDWLEEFATRNPKDTRLKWFYRSRQGIAYIKEYCRPIIDSLNEHCERTGWYPPRLPQSSVVILEKLPFKYNYSMMKGGEDCELIVGHYIDEGIEWRWEASDASWVVEGG